MLQQFKMHHVAMAGAAAGLGTTLILTPVEYVKCQLQVQQGNATRAAAAKAKGIPSNVPGFASYVIRTEGVGGLFKGMWPTLLRELPGNAVWFVTYEAVGRALANRRAKVLGITKAEAHNSVPSYEVILAGGSAGE